MSYVSVQFLLFTAVCFGLYYILPKKCRPYILLCASAFFYVLFSKYLIAVSLGLTAIVYFVSRKIGKIDDEFKAKKKELSKEERKAEKKKIKKSKKKLVTVECVIAFGLLVVFKYLGFLTGTVNSFIALFSQAKIPVLALMMPIGISYYTLSIVGYAVDVYRGTGKAEKNFAKLYLFTIYFPHIVEGPIGNYQSFSSQIDNTGKLTFENFMSAFELILIGLVKKMIIADRAALFSNPAFDNYKDYTALAAVVAILMYAINIYFDFSGCMDIVCGVSELFGIKLPQNFRQPFFSGSVQEFWRRWHITLGDWIKKYIFYSVSMSKVNQKIMTKCNQKIKSSYMKTTLPMLFALLFVWLFNGIWHGASWKYIVYGMYYYVILSLGMLFEPLFEKICTKLSINRESKAFKVFQIIRTDFLVVIGLAMFRADTLRAFAGILRRVFDFSNLFGSLMALKDAASLSTLDFPVVVFFAIAMLVISIKKEKGTDIRQALSEKKVLRWILCTAAVVCIVMLGVYGSMYSEVPFVYAQF